MKPINKVIKTDKISVLEPMLVYIGRLDAGKKYFFHVRVSEFENYISNGWRGSKQILNTKEWITIPVYTLPAKLESPLLESKTDKTITIRWKPYKNIADGSTFLYYEVKIRNEKTGNEVITYGCLSIRHSIVHTITCLINMHAC